MAKITALLYFSGDNPVVKECNDTSNHQPKMTYTHGAVKPSKHMLLGMDLKSYWFRESSRNY